MDGGYSGFCEHAQWVDHGRGFLDPDPMALADFCRRIGAARARLVRLVREVEDGGRNGSTDQPLLAELQSIRQEFERLCTSCLAWHDVHGEDLELMHRVKGILVEWDPVRIATRRF